VQVCRGAEFESAEVQRSEVQRCRGAEVQSEVQKCRSAEMQRLQMQMQVGRVQVSGLQVCRCADVQVCSDVQFQRCRGAEVQCWW
jgi:hypothetical protein